MIAMRDIQAFSEAIAREFKPRRIILFGSHARGDASEDSDVDLLVVMPYRGHPARKAAEIRSRLDAPLRWIYLSDPRERCTSATGWRTGSSAKSLTKARFFMKPETAEWVAKAQGDFASAGRKLRARKDPSCGKGFARQRARDRILAPAD